MSSAYSATASATPKAVANGAGSYPSGSGVHSSSAAAAAARHQHHLHFHRMRHRFSLTNILGDPFALSTISIGSIGWVVALCGSITVSTATSKFPVFTWWGVASQFLVIIAVFWVCATNNVHPYRLALLASLATTTVYTTNSTNNFVYNSTPSSAAASAGFILLSIINILWMIYFGTTEEAPLHRFVDSYSVNKPNTPYDSYYHNPMDMGYTNLNNNRLVSGLSRQQTNPFSHSAAAAQSSAMATGINAGINAYGQQQQRGAYSDNTNSYNKYYTQGQQNSIGAGSYGMDVLSQPAYHQQQPSFMAAPLGAFENSSQIHHKPSTASGLDQGGYGANNTLTLGGSTGGYRESQASSDGEVSLPTEYPYRVRANYSYVATDENELSFKKDEILEVNEIRGKWWQARRENGEIGICPSNYVRLLNYGWGAAAIAAGLVGPDGMAHYASAQQQSGYDSMTTTTSTTTGYHQNL
ncbi:uncharacterized protein SAPINGB_P000923 [Magnusiomyces paraingens]|uniref:High osmolarity signaling protein SHO1 n=1 Tax=Magnusiomyces paraingens TaxID=2606893 RepID=A0A5E8B4U3_9ASCO|nr:uncharacterized protein SAPINGB_P000923 [Saprochaete ingens]VVT45852.1 unnamed protein product [Saprochaete ingens]